ncbi:hypothetical protein [Egicoccus sp. AB-alg2]|uniref:hypothetical protein n=1 Tax=Egicoccus sp. AB-alg2 TaxID=3242693 RepID=UPI00359E82A7
MPASTQAHEEVGTGAPAGRRWPPAGRGQGLLLLAALGVVLGSFLPWVDTVAGRFTGMHGAGVWTFYAGVLGLAGGLVPRRGLARIHGAVLALVAVGLPLWQTLHLANVCDWRTCLPSVGLVLVAGCGVLAGRASWLLGRAPG